VASSWMNSGKISSSASKLGMATGFLRAASTLFGNSALSRAAQAGRWIGAKFGLFCRGAGAPGHAAAFSQLLAEVRPAR